MVHIYPSSMSPGNRSARHPDKPQGKPGEHPPGQTRIQARQSSTRLAGQHSAGAGIDVRLIDEMYSVTGQAIKNPGRNAGALKLSW